MRQRNVLDDLFALIWPSHGTIKRIKRRLGPTFVSCFGLFVAAAMLASFSLFEYEETLWSSSRDTFYRAFAPLYPGTKDRAASVVLLNDESFRKFDSYPVKYQTHANVLRAIASFSPRAIFIDFAFIDERPDQTISDLIQVLEELKARGIIVYVPIHRREPNEPGLRSDLAELVKNDVIVPVSFNLGRSLWGTPLYTMRSNCMPTVRESDCLLTVSAQIMKDFSPDVFEAHLRRIKEFEIWWGLPPAEVNCKRMTDDGCGSEYWLSTRMISSLDFRILPLDFHLLNNTVKLPYAPTIYANEVLDGDKRAAIQSALYSKFVFYGPDLDIARDNYPNPVFSYRSDERVLPGVFFHAMALENMINLQNHVKIARPNDRPTMWFRDILSIAIVCVVLFFFRVIVRRPSTLTSVGAIFFASCAIALIEFLYFDLAPSNWIGVFSFISISEAVKADSVLIRFAFRLISGRPSRDIGG